MAQLILSPIAAKIIGALGSAAVKEIASLWGVNDELEELEDTISTIKAVLLDAEEKQILNNKVKNWLQRLGGVVFDADTLMDEIKTEALRREVMSGNHKMAKQVRTFFSSSNQVAFRFKMVRRIKEIKRKLATVSNDINLLNLEVRNEETRVVRRARVDSHSFIRNEEVIGRDEDRLAIVKLLLEGRETEFKENVLVIPIVGLGGLGKTTLAQSIFNHKEVQQHFELRIWVCVSENFDLELIIQNIIKSATGKTNLGDIKMDQLQKDLRKELGGKRYLLVLDDVWEENREKWLKLKELIICGADGSRVVVTTRSTKVSDITFDAVPYRLEKLNKENSWSLFKKVAFKQGQELKSSNEKIGMEIVKRCRGIPLAIKTIGNLLYGKNSESEWSSFNKEFSKISQEREDGILPTLKLSYDHLPSHLKHCFAYCRLFPKDYYIHVATLIQLWMAQGFLKLSDPGHDQCLEDVGYEYFIYLLQGSFFQEAQEDEWGIVETCKMHDLMHDLAVQVAGAECATLGLDYEGHINKHTHHVLFKFGINSANQIPSSFVQASKIQTILLFRPSLFVDVKVKESFCNAIISNFKFIRSIDLHCLKLVPNSIGKLKHLRYLDLSFNDLKALPSSITNLQNLQTLKLNCCTQLQELPRDIQKLINLRHLEISGCDELNHMPRGLGQLKNLQTLSKYVLISKSTKPVPRHGGELKELMDLNSLRGKLEIENLCHGKDVAAEYERANLKEKQYLRSLKLGWDYFDVEIDATESIVVGYEMSMKSLEPHPSLQELTVVNYLGVQLSSWLPSLTKLVNLTLSECTKCQYLVPSNQFPCLKYLRLDRLESLEYIFNSNGNNSFLHSILLPSLQQLELIDLPNLKGWWREFVDNSIVANEENQIMLLPYFASLSKLLVYNCHKLTQMPLYPHLEGQLTLINTSLKPFQETMMMSPTTSSFSPLSKLTSLHIADIEDLECLPDWFESLSSLNHLHIENFPKLKDLCPGILSSLRSLSIANCEELAEMLNGEDDDHVFMWKTLNGRLQSLTLGNLPKVMTVFPKGIRHLTGLRRLEFWRCDSLTTIPEWIDNLQSLETLEFKECPNLTSLPEGIRSLTTLKTLDIRFCPMLLKRCKRQIGEDWHKISHIQHLRLSPDPNREHGNLVKKTKTRNLFNKFGLCNISARNQ